MVPSGPARDLALRHDELLPEQRVFGDETGAAAQDVGGQPHHEPKDVDHAPRRTAASARMTFVARTGGNPPPDASPVASPAPKSTAEAQRDQLLKRVEAGGIEPPHGGRGRLLESGETSADFSG